MRFSVTLLFTVLALFSVSLFAPSVQAASDSVAVFHRADRVIVVINERASRSAKLPLMMDELAGSKESFQLKTPDKGVWIRCARGSAGATCTMTFLPSQFVEITSSNGERSVEMQVPLFRDMKTEFSFESSMGDSFSFVSDGDVLTIWAAKRKLSAK